MINVYQKPTGFFSMFSTLGLMACLLAAANWLTTPEVDPCCGVKQKERRSISRWNAEGLDEEDRRKQMRYREKSQSQWQRRQPRRPYEKTPFRPIRSLPRF